MSKKTYYYGGLFVLVVGIAIIIFTIVKTPKEAIGYVTGVLCLGLGLFLMVSYFASQEELYDEENIDDVIASIDQNDMNAHESIIVDLKNKTLTTKLNIIEYIVSSKNNIYLKVLKDNLFHVMICENYVEIESLDANVEVEIKELEEKAKCDPASRRKYEKEMAKLMNKGPESVFYLKFDITGKNKEEIISMIENKIL